MAISFQFRDEDAKEMTDALAKANSKGGFAPGIHAVSIVDVGPVAVMRNDDTWVQFPITLEGVGGRSKKQFIFVPTQSIKYNGKMTMFAGLVRFFNGLGQIVNSDNYREVLAKFFSGDMSQLIGLKTQIKLGYTKDHMKKVDDKIVIVDVNDQPIIGLPTFADFKECESYAKMAARDIQSFAEIMEYRCTNENTAKINAIMGIGEASID